MDIELFIENEHLIYDGGDLYCIKESCDGCKFANGCEYIDSNILTDLTPPIRECIGVDNDNAFSDENDKPYSYNFVDEPVLGESPFFIKKTLTELLPEQDTADFILFNEDSRDFTCYRQVCSTCKFVHKCNPTLTKVRKEYITASLDLKSQEPKVNTLVTKEPNWINIFQNDGLRGIPKSLDYLICAFTAMGVNCKTHKFRKWVDSKFFFDKSELYDFNLKVFEYQRNSNKENIDSLKETLVTLLSQFNNYGDSNAK